MACADSADEALRPGAGAITSRQMPSTCTVSTTGYAAPCPDGEHATRAASSRRNGTNSSASSATPCPSTSAASAGDEHTHTPLPSYPPLTALSTTGHEPPGARQNASTSATEDTGAYRGHGTPSAVSRSRIASLSWVYRSAADPGRTRTPADSRLVRICAGTCSWSNVTTSHSPAKDSTSDSDRCDPIATSCVTSAALSEADSASTRNVAPRPIAACAVIRASCPPPTMPTMGIPVPDLRGIGPADVDAENTRCSLRGTMQSWVQPPWRHETATLRDTTASHATHPC